MKTAGVLLDFYDDPTGAVLKSAFPTPDKLPLIVKTAHILTPEEREILRDDAYALVMQNEGKVFRKFACVDPGNTLLSLLYFEKNASLLPESARERAGRVIFERAREFGILDVVKTAAKSPQRSRDPMRQPMVGDEADWAERTNLRSIQGGKDGGRVAQVSQTLNTKMASVDVTGQEPGVVFTKQASSRHALGDKYPLDSYADVRAAVAYFSESWPDFEPLERHEFAKNASARAEEIGLDVPPIMARYGSTGYAPDVEAHLANRKANCAERFHGIYDALKEKRAQIEPEHFAALLARADVACELNWEWGGAVQDPWFATFGGRTGTEKTAFGWEGGGYQVDAETLQEAAASGALAGHFQEDVVKAFEKDPVAIFSSMPDDMKVVMARLATEA